MQLAEKYDVGEETIMQLIKAHREAIPANSNKSEWNICSMDKKVLYKDGSN